MSLPPNPTDWLNKGDNAWQLTAATLVGLQSIPGLVILYGGMVKKKWAINSALMTIYAFAVVLICWVGWGYRLSFGDELVLFWGKPGVALSEEYLLKQGFAGNFPTATMVFFQFVFAAITPILVGGAVLGRMNFYAWMLFVPLWHTFSYTVGAYSIWNPNGWLAKLGIIDFAGGYVIHLSSGVAGFTAAYWVWLFPINNWVGPRSEEDRERFPPNNILMMLTGAGLLWMGWSGFNGGAPYAANGEAALAILNTHVCTATSLITWLFLDILTFGKPSVIGAVQGMITGLVCITPAAGIVQCWAAILMGLLSGSIPWYTMMVIHFKIKLLRYVDDTFAIFHTHAVAGALGGVMTGFFAVPKLCRIFYNVTDGDKYIGLAYTGKTISVGLKQMGIQILGMVFIICLNVVITSMICLIISVFIPLRLNDEELEIGDDAVHGEEAYAIWGDGEKVMTNVNSAYDADEYPSYASKVSIPQSTSFSKNSREVQMV